jgi:DNA (cytosine-5)-methyltransferase 1
LVELFGGYGSQALALKYLGIPFEHHFLSEWAVKSIQAYKDMHEPNDNTDYSKDLSDTQITDFLDGRISADHNVPMTRKQIEKHAGGENWRRRVYNNMMATKNKWSIMAINGRDIGIVDTDKYCYIMTYSFPCQDLSSAGKGAGMEKGSGTRSGLLWEVERLLTEVHELPQVLLMENVPEVIGTKNMPHFQKWIAFLDSLGYKTKVKVLNTKEFGIPQNRARCFAVSVLGDFYYEHPNGFPLEKRLKDILQKEVSDDYYLKEDILKYFTKHGYLRQDGTVGTITTDGSSPKHNNRIVEPIIYDDYNQRVRADQDTIGTITTNIGNDAHRNGQKLIEPMPPKVVGGVGEMKSNGGTPFYQQDRVYEGDGIAMCHPASIPGGSYNYQMQDFRVRKLTEKECFRLQGVRDGDFERVMRNQSRSSCYHLAGDSITVSVLMALFGEMLDVDWRSKIDELAEDLCRES